MMVALAVPLAALAFAYQFAELTGAQPGVLLVGLFDVAAPFVTFALALLMLRRPTTLLLSGLWLTALAPVVVTAPFMITFGYSFLPAFAAALAGVVMTYFASEDRLSRPSPRTSN